MVITAITNETEEGQKIYVANWNGIQITSLRFESNGPPISKTPALTRKTLHLQYSDTYPIYTTGSQDGFSEVTNTANHGSSIVAEQKKQVLATLGKVKACFG